LTYSHAERVRRIIERERRGSEPVECLACGDRRSMRL